MDSTLLYVGIGLVSLLLFFYFNSSNSNRETERQEQISSNGKTQLQHFKEISRKDLKNNEKDFFVIIDNNIYNFEHFSKKELFSKMKGDDITEEFFDIEEYVELFKEIEELQIGIVPLNEKMKRKRKIKNYTKEQVLKHNSYEDAWLIIENKIYDVTEYTPEHPGGDLILTKVGQDSTVDYLEAKHPSYVSDMLEDFYIGDIKN
eukprot:gene2475-3184_t